MWKGTKAVVAFASSSVLDWVNANYDLWNDMTTDAYPVVIFFLFVTKENQAAFSRIMPYSLFVENLRKYTAEVVQEFGVGNKEFFFALCPELTAYFLSCTIPFALGHHASKSLEDSEHSDQKYTWQRESLTTQSVATLISDLRKTWRHSDSVKSMDVTETSDEDANIEVEDKHFEDDGNNDNGNEDFCCSVGDTYQSQIDSEFGRDSEVEVMGDTTHCERQQTKYCGC